MPRTGTLPSGKRDEDPYDSSDFDDRAVPYLQGVDTALQLQNKKIVALSLQASEETFLKLKDECARSGVQARGRFCCTTSEKRIRENDDDGDQRQALVVSWTNNLGTAVDRQAEWVMLLRFAGRSERCRDLGMRYRKMVEQPGKTKKKATLRQVVENVSCGEFIERLDKGRL